MERPPLVGRTVMVTSVEDRLIELQRDTDAEHYEAKFAELQRMAEEDCPHGAKNKRACDFCWPEVLEAL